MKTYDNLPENEWSSLCMRPTIETQDLEPLISNIFDKVSKESDAALLAYTKKFDGILSQSVAVSNDELRQSAAQIPKKLKEAIDSAYANILVFHKAQQDSMKPIRVTTQPGVKCWREPRPIERVGLYVPGGTAPLFSTVLMLGIPAQLAGCREIIMCTPPQKDNSLNPAICYAAQLVGVNKVVKVGGAQAIAALTIGTQSVPSVDKIFGPGNQFVTYAKQYATRFGVAMDMPAGPSELIVIADRSARPDFVAADLLSQAEHGTDSQVALVTTSKIFVKKIMAELNRQLTNLPRREIAIIALANSFCLITDNISQAIKFANQYAPEHLTLNITNAKSVADQVQNAGSVFIGNYTTESAGDYASGTNHTLPTGGWARNYSGLSLENYCKYISFQSINKKGASQLAPTVMTMAKAEGLEAHKRAMELRS
jgi:histidinol dehydrogenase